MSNDLDEFAQTKTRQKDKPRGQVSQTEDGMVEVWVKSWAELSADCKGRMRFVQEKLKANVDRDDALTYLRTTYAKYLNDVPEAGECEDSALADETVPLG